jgi:hypothetical protein
MLPGVIRELEMNGPILSKITNSSL